MVKTPWFDYEIPFTRAAEIGTRKVIHDHSTIGIVVTTDGSFGEIKRSGYINAEETAVEELKAIGKPFIILLNCERPYSEETIRLAGEMEEKYGVSVMPVNCEQLKKEDITRILEKVLKEFPVTEIDFYIPKWLELLPALSLAEREGYPESPRHHSEGYIYEGGRLFTGNVIFGRWGQRRPDPDPADEYGRRLCCHGYPGG